MDSLSSVVSGFAGEALGPVNQQRAIVFSSICRNNHIESPIYNPFLASAGGGSRKCLPWACKSQQEHSHIYHCIAALVIVVLSMWRSLSGWSLRNDCVPKIVSLLSMICKDTNNQQRVSFVTKKYMWEEPNWQPIQLRIYIVPIVSPPDKVCGSAPLNWLLLIFIVPAVSGSETRTSQWAISLELQDILRTSHLLKLVNASKWSGIWPLIELPSKESTSKNVKGDEKRKKQDTLATYSWSTV